MHAVASVICSVLFFFQYYSLNFVRILQMVRYIRYNSQWILRTLVSFMRTLEFDPDFSLFMLHMSPEFPWLSLSLTNNSPWWTSIYVVRFYFHLGDYFSSVIDDTPINLPLSIQHCKAPKTQNYGRTLYQDGYLVSNNCYVENNK